MRLALVAILVAGCGPDVVATTRPDVPTGRSVCPGAVPDAAGTVPDLGATAMERLQTMYETDPGFLAVIWDNRQPVVVVARDDLEAWQARLAPLQTAVAPSCINPTLLSLVLEALPRMGDQGVRGGGYDALADAIFVSGVQTDALLTVLDGLRPGTKDAALEAIAAGTLRVTAADLPASRQ